MEQGLCINCGEQLVGRVGKKYCNAYCKSAYQYKTNKEKEPSFYTKVDLQLKKNRRILKNYNKSGKSIVRKSSLVDEGFDARFVTHWWKNKKGEVYLFCYEYGFLSKVENGKEKYVLVKWQKYME